VDQAGISARAEDRLQGCVVIGGILVGVGLGIILAGGAFGILIAGLGQAVLLVGIIGFAVKLGVEAAAHSSSGPSGSD
jgi:hypothetical protein